MFSSFPIKSIFSQSMFGESNKIDYDKLANMIVEKMSSKNVITEDTKVTKEETEEETKEQKLKKEKTTKKSKKKNEEEL